MIHLKGDIKSAESMAMLLGSCLSNLLKHLVHLPAFLYSGCSSILEILRLHDSFLTE